MTITCGIDWAQGHHDVAVVDEQGRQLARARIDTGLGGFTDLVQLLTEHSGGQEPGEVPVAIETDKNMLVVALQAAGYTVYPINPRAVARYREGHGQAGKKSDPGDSMVLADILRTDRHRHRTLPALSEKARAVKALARQHQEAIWAEQQTTSRLRSVLLEFYPRALQAFPQLKHKAALAVLAAAPTPAKGLRMTPSRLVTLPHRCGRRNDPTLVERVLAALKTAALRQPPAVEDALGVTVSGLVAIITAMQASVAQLEDALAAEFSSHDLAPVLRSAPGLGPVLAARVLAEVGDDPHRFTSPRPARVRRDRPRHPRVGTVPVRQRPPGTQQAPERRVPLVGVLYADEVLRRPSPLRPPQGGRRLPQRRPAPPREQAHRSTLVVPAARATLGRDHRLAHPIDRPRPTWKLDT